MVSWSIALRLGFQPLPESVAAQVLRCLRGPSHSSSRSSRPPLRPLLFTQDLEDVEKPVMKFWSRSSSLFRVLNGSWIAGSRGLSTAPKKCHPALKIRQKIGRNLLVRFCNITVTVMAGGTRFFFSLLFERRMWQDLLLRPVFHWARRMFLPPWILDFNSEVEIKTVSVWIRLLHKDSISAIGSNLGRFIVSIVPKGGLYSCAHICVEVDLD